MLLGKESIRCIGINCNPIIEELRQKDNEFLTNLGYVMRPFQEKERYSAFHFSHAWIKTAKASLKSLFHLHPKCFLIQWSGFVFLCHSNEFLPLEQEQEWQYYHFKHWYQNSIYIFSKVFPFLSSHRLADSNSSFKDTDSIIDGKQKQPGCSCDLEHSWITVSVQNKFLSY